MKKRLCILCGGQSPEHQVSLQSARNVLAAVDRRQFEVTLVGIARSGDWNLHDPANYLAHADDTDRVALIRPLGPVAIVCRRGRGHLVRLDGAATPRRLDVAFPVLHGAYGEDGAVQGLLKMANLACVGCDVAGSAIGMDKDLTKRLLRQAGVPVAPSLTLSAGDARPDTAALVRRLGLPLFVKPARLGSSVGITQVKTAAALGAALRVAFRYDDKVLVESKIVGREIECAVLGNATPRASAVGEVIPRTGFYSYAAKYLDPNGARLDAPAQLDTATVRRVKAVALASYRALGCLGMSRVDMFLTPRGRIIVNEINTIPGFTKISMYPRLWGLAGVDYPALVSELIRLALERFAAEQRLVTEPDAG